MLRWKTQSTICAILISACPLTSFAQQIVEQNPSGSSNAPVRTVAASSAIQPLTRASQGYSTALNPSETVPLARQLAKDVVSPDIVIRSPFVQPHNPNLYLFVVENIGPVNATVAAVDLRVPQNITITNVVPTPSSGDGQWAHVRLTNLAAGSKSIIEVEISPTTEAFEFTTRMALESVQNFTATPNSNYLGYANSNRAALSKEIVSAMLRKAAESSKYLIPDVKVTHAASPRLAAVKNVNVAALQSAKSTASEAQNAADAKLLQTVRSLRLAGQDALADAYIAAVANSKTYQAETF